MSSISISVIIPLFKDWDRLKLCLEALERQRNANLSFEVIVVNNNPADSFTLSDSFSFPIKYLKESVPGSYSARNRGLSQAVGSALLFTDSDCIPAPDWIFQALKLLEEDRFDLFAGAIELFSQAENRYVRFEKAFAFPNSTYVSENSFGVTANLLVKKKVIDSIGGFNVHQFTGGDSEFCNRAVNVGFQIIYSPKLLVKHPARSTWDELRVKAIRFGGRLPKGENFLVITLKLLGKFRVRFKDIKEIKRVDNASVSDKLDFFMIKQQLRWVEAMESFSVFLGKKPGRE